MAITLADIERLEVETIRDAAKALEKQAASMDETKAGIGKLHATPSYLINVDNGNELFGETIKASPGVIGDWTENEEAEKRAREAEIRRYKSMGWNVKFE
ncbi:Hypothetical protein ERS075545_05124 [Mycobacteroides abscessus]|nr:Hypothetical protein ERS075545_05124 [Mycobacteroides abscessus]